MAHFKNIFLKFKKKPFRNLSAWGLTIGAVAAIGFLGFSGAFLIYASIPLAVAVFIFSGAIEETVYGESIYKGLGRLKLIGANGERNFFILGLDNYLDALIEKNGEEILTEQKKEIFLKDYYLLRKYYKNLKKISSNEKEITKTKEKLNDLRDYLYTKTIKKRIDVTDKAYIGNDLQLVNKNLLRVARRNLWVLRSIFFVSLIVGLGAGLVTASAMNAALLSLGVALSVTALAAIIWPIAILATVATVFLLYKNMSDFFKEDSAALDLIKATGRFIHKFPSKVWQGFRQLPANLKRLFHPTEKVSIKATLIAFIRGFFKFTIGLVIIGVTLFAAIAALFTCSAAIKSGLDMIPGVPLILIAIFYPVLITLNFIMDLTYGLSTTSETIQALFSIRLTDIKIQLINKFNLLRSQEAFLQIINPFRLIVNTINGLFKLLIFSAHVLSIGITTDNLGKIPPLVVAIGCSLPEALQDASFFIGKNTHAHEHDHGGLIMRGLVLVKNIILMTSLIWLFDALWNLTFKKKADGLTLKKTLINSIKRCCDIEGHDHAEKKSANTAPPQLSKLWTDQVGVKSKLLKAIERLDGSIIDRKIANEKQEVLQKVLRHSDDIIARIENKTPIPDAINLCLREPVANGCIKNSGTKNFTETGKGEESAFGVLSRHRGVFEVNKPTTTQIVKNIFSDFAAQAG